ncbi:MAG: hypothetical protein WD379_04555 [Dehalococcoidia bacterium]
MRRRILAAYLGLLGLLAATLAAGGVLFFRDLTSGDPIDAVANRHAYDVAGWELRHLTEKWAYKLANLFDSPRNEAESDALLQAYFELTAEIAALERSGDDPRRLEGARGDRDAIENDVEELLESRISDFLADEGLVMNPPLFSDIDLFFPPLDFELDRSPRVLAVSPRDRIELDRSYLLEPGLLGEEIAAIEGEAERQAGVSALVVGTGGVATYPSVIPELASYGSMVETVIHEWLHQYLAFFPLGSGYFSGDEARTLNETVASMAGRELAEGFIVRFGSPEPEAEAGPEPSPPNGFDFRAEMRGLRLRVEELLGAGRVEEAERLMDEKRDEFESEGVFIRRINQAYFAFNGSYADSAGSIDPIGPKMERLRESAGSAAAFVLLARGLTSEADLDRLLERG